MVKTLLSEEEKEILHGYFKTSPLVLMRLKSQAILMRDREIKYIDIAAVLSKNERTVRRWVKDFENRRMASIFTGHSNNENASKLTREQKEEIKRVLAEKPSAYGLPKEFWDVRNMCMQDLTWCMNVFSHIIFC